MGDALGGEEESGSNHNAVPEGRSVWSVMNSRESQNSNMGHKKKLNLHVTSRDDSRHHRQEI